MTAFFDVVPDRSGHAYAGWLQAQPEAFVAGIEHAALDPFRGYANALRDELPDAVAVLDAFHVVKLGTQVVDEVRRRVQQETLGRRGHKDDPLSLYKVRGLLRRGHERGRMRPKAAARTARRVRTSLGPVRAPCPRRTARIDDGALRPAPGVDAAQRPPR